MKLRGLVGTLILLFVWWGISHSGWIKPILLPPPNAVLIEMSHFLTSPSILGDLWLSTERLLVTLSVSILVGVPVGILLGSFKWLADPFEFQIAFFRSLPATVLYPLFMVVFGVGELSVKTLIIFASSLIILTYSMDGVKNCPETRIKAAKSMRLNSFQMFYRVVFPESLPNIITGIRISMSLALILVVVLEMLTGPIAGIGRRIYDHSQTFRIKEMYAGVVTVGTLGYLLNKGISILDNRFLHWRGR